MNNLADRVYRLFSWKSPQHYTSAHQNEFEISSEVGRNHTATRTTASGTGGSSEQSDSSELINLSMPSPPQSRRSSSLSWLSSSSQTNARQNGSSNPDSSRALLLNDLNRNNDRGGGGGVSEASSSGPVNNNNNNATSNSSNVTQFQIPVTNSNTNSELQQNTSTNIVSFGVSQHNSSSNSENSRSIMNNNRRHSSSSSSSRRHRSSRSSRSSNNNNNSNNQSNSLQLLFQNSFNTSSNQSNANASANNSNNLYDLFNSHKKRERNLLSACCSVFCITILAVSLVETRWFYLNGGGCNLNYIGVGHFFAPGRLEYQIELSKVTKNEIIVYNFILPNGLVLKNCANREILIIMRTIIAFVFLAIFSSCLGLILDTFGCMHLCFKLTRRHGIFHILTVVLCLAINGFCFWISERMAEQQFETRLKKGKKIDISFDVSYYLIVLASGMSILATAFTLIRRYSSDEDEQLERLLEEYTGFEDPVHLERSLPATAEPALQHHSLVRNNLASPCHNQDYYFFNTHATSGSNPPPPPATPPPQLHQSHHHHHQQQQQTNLINFSPITNSLEPPPPYNSLNDSNLIV